MGIGYLLLVIGELLFSRISMAIFMGALSNLWKNPSRPSGTPPVEGIFSDHFQNSRSSLPSTFANPCSIFDI